MDGTTYKLQQRVPTANGLHTYIDIGSAYTPGQLVELRKLAKQYLVKDPSLELLLLTTTRKTIPVGGTRDQES